MRSHDSLFNCQRPWPRLSAGGPKLVASGPVVNQLSYRLDSRPGLPFARSTYLVILRDLVNPFFSFPSPLFQGRSPRDVSPGRALIRALPAAPTRAGGGAIYAFPLPPSTPLAIFSDPCGPRQASSGGLAEARANTLSSARTGYLCPTRPCVNTQGADSFSAALPGGGRPWSLRHPSRFGYQRAIRGRSRDPLARGSPTQADALSISLGPYPASPCGTLSAGPPWRSPAPPGALLPCHGTAARGRWRLAPPSSVRRACLSVFLLSVNHLYSPSDVFSAILSQP